MTPSVSVLSSKPRLEPLEGILATQQALYETVCGVLHATNRHPCDSQLVAHAGSDRNGTTTSWYIYVDL